MNGVAASETSGSASAVSAAEISAVEYFMGPIVGRRIVAGKEFGFEGVRLIFNALSRQPELAKIRLPGERLVWTASDLDPEERARVQRPWLDEWILGRTGPRQSPWPENKPFALCLSHDMDHITSFAGRESRRRLARRWRMCGPRSPEFWRQAIGAGRASVSSFVREKVLRRDDRYRNVGDWLRIEADCGFNSSLYFFAGEISPWHPFDCDYALGDRVRFEGATATVGTMMREISDRGWEVSLHGSIASATQPGALRRQKEEIEDAIGRPAETTRQHYLQYDPAVTPDLQAEAGFIADTSQGFNDLVGYRAGTCFPYLVWSRSRGEMLPLLEVPLHVQDGPMWGAAPSVEAAVVLCVRMMDQVQAMGGCMGLLFHPLALSTERGLAVYREVLQEAYRRNAWGCSTRELAHWWLARGRRFGSAVDSVV
jgi:hypothetical protein